MKEILRLMPLPDSYIKGYVEEKRPKRKKVKAFHGDHVDQIRKLYATGEYKQKQLAEKFNLSPSAVSQILNKQNRYYRSRVYKK